MAFDLEVGEHQSNPGVLGALNLVDQRRFTRPAPVCPSELVQVGTLELGKQLLTIGRGGLAVLRGPHPIHSRLPALGRRLRAHRGERLQRFPDSRVGAV